MVLHSSEVQLVAGGRDGAVQDPRHLQRVTRKVQGGEEEKEFGGLIKFPHLPRTRTQSHGSTERQWLLGSAVPTGWLISQARCGKGGHLLCSGSRLRLQGLPPRMRNQEKRAPRVPVSFFENSSS